MTTYKQFNLLDVAKVSGLRISKFDGLKKYVATADVNLNKIVGGEDVTYDNRPSRADLIMGQHDVLFAKMKNTVKVLAGSPEVEGKVFSTGFYILTPKENINKKYLYFYLHGADFNHQKDLYSSGATMAAIGNDGLKRIKISIPVDSKGNPDIKEQRRIVTLLEEAEEIKRKRAEADQKMVTAIPALFSQMFGKEKFETRKLGESITYLTSGARGWAKYYAYTPGFKYIRIQNVKNARLDFSDVQYVKPPEAAESKRIKVQENDLLISITADLGRTAVVDRGTALEGAFINQHIALIRLEQDYNPIFVAHYLENEGKYQFLKYGQAAAKKGLNFDSIKSIRIPKPPKKMQDKFAERVKEITALEEKQKRSTVNIYGLFSSILAGAFVNK